MQKERNWVHHRNYLLEDALSLIKCLLLEDGSWNDNLYLTAVCSLALLDSEKEIRRESLEWLRRTILSFKDTEVRKLLKDKFLILGIFLGSKILSEKDPEFPKQAGRFLGNLIKQLEDKGWNRDTDFPSILLFSLSRFLPSSTLENSKKFLGANIERLLKDGRKSSAIFSFLGLLQFDEGRIIIADIMKRSMTVLDPGSLPDLKSNAILLFTVSEMETKHKYLLYSQLEENLRREFLEIRDNLLRFLFVQLSEAIRKEKHILSNKEKAVDRLKEYSDTSEAVNVGIPRRLIMKLLEKPHLSDIAFSVLAIRRSSFDELYSFDKQTFEQKCKPALEPSNYIQVRKVHLLFFTAYVAVAIISLSSLSYLLSNSNPLVAAIIAFILAALSYKFAKNYFTQLISEIVGEKREES
jgi:hypothetical protein